MTPERFQRITSVLDQRQPDLTLVMDQVHKGRNLSAMVRTADAVGIDHIHSVVPKAGFQYYRGTALGSHKWVDVIQHRCIEHPLQQLKQSGHQLLGAHLADSAIDYRDIDYTQPTAIIFGTEKQGLSSMAIESLDYAITVPMQGMVASFNVSVACGIILAEAQRQRMLAGFYSTRRLADSDYQNHLFRWGHPQVADFCDQRQLTYPKLDHNGDIVNGAQWYAQLRQGQGVTS